MLKDNIVIGIEGLVGAGKTSVCRQLINEIPNSILLNGGNLYRTIVYAIMSEEKSLFAAVRKLKKTDIKKIMDKNKIDIRIQNNETFFYINNKLADETDIQSKKNSLAVSVIGGLADNSNLFKFAKEYIESIRKTNNVIISGRQILKIYPETTYHFFITADLKERVNRKYIQYNGLQSKLIIKKHIKKRDKLQKIAGFYKISANTICVDLTQCKTVDESTRKILEYIKL